MLARLSAGYEAASLTQIAATPMPNARRSGAALPWFISLFTPRVRDLAVFSLNINVPRFNPPGSAY
jgi:hypothetical protein